jgi:hypothetical protein
MPFSRPVLDLINEASASSSVPELPAIFGSATTAAPSNEISRRLKSAFHDACDHINRETVWLGAWRTAEFTVPAGTEGVPFPPDMDRIRSETFYQEGMPYFASHGSETALHWRAHKALPHEPLTHRWRLGADRILMHPVPSDQETFTFEYVTGWYSVDPQDNFKDRVTQDTDRLIFDNNIVKLELKWRILREFGEPYDGEYMEAAQAIARRKAQEQAPGVISYGSQRPDDLAGYFAGNRVVLG